ncbi:MAG: choice-of-anchor Q domain-containing protein [Caldilineaceae bacterium]
MPKITPEAMCIVCSREVRRARWLFLFAPCIVGLLLCVAPVYAQTSITVTTDQDTVAADGLCSLREAVIAANTDGAFNDCPAGSGADTITFSSNLPLPLTIVLTQTGQNEDNAATGDLDIAGELTIAGEQVTIDGNDADRVFEILSGARVTMTGLTVRNGNPGAGKNGGGLLLDLTARLTMTNSQVISNTALQGGGLFVLGGLTLNDSTVDSNRGGGIQNSGGLVTLNHSNVTNHSNGYAIRNEGSGSLTVNGGLIDNNQGGVYNSVATATLTGVTVSNNKGNGGVSNLGDVVTKLTVQQTLFLLNRAANGGAILNQGTGANATVRDSLFMSNTATASGGAIFTFGGMGVSGSTFTGNHARSGGAIRNASGNLGLTNVTISQNSAADNGGGLYNGSDTSSAVLKHVTLAANRANGANTGGNIFNDESSLSIVNSIVADATAGGNCANSSGFLTSQGHNLESTNTCSFTAAGDLVNTAPLLGLLQNNGGHTFTRALLVDSPALDQADSANCTPTDQRGVSRPQGTACDVGAYERFVTPPASTATITVEPAAPTTSDPISITVAGELPNSCTPHRESFAMNGHAIDIVSGPTDAQICLPVSTAWSYSVQVGPLAAGVYTITHHLIDAVSVSTFTVSAIVVTPITGLSAANDSPTPLGALTHLSATITAGSDVTYLWDFGDGASGNRANLSHIYPAVGAYTATVTATNSLSSTTATTVVSVVSPTVTTGVTITVQPTMPNSSDLITITLGGIYRNSCTPSYASHEVAGNVIEIRSQPSGELFCLPAETPWHYSVTVGPLASGQYTIVHRLETQVDSLPLTVVAVIGNGSPFFETPREPVAVTIGMPFTFTIKAVGDPSPTYTLLSGPVGMTIDAQSGEVHWTPTADYMGEVTVKVQAANSQGVAEESFTFIVQPVMNEQLFLPVIARDRS